MPELEKLRTEKTLKRISLGKAERLTFTAVDDLAFAAERGRLQGKPATSVFVPAEIGPLIELAKLSANGPLPPVKANPWIALDAYSAFYNAMTSGRNQWFCPNGHKLGFIRTTWDPAGDDTQWTAFLVEAQRIAEASGFPKMIAAQLMGAIGELQSNIYEHSEAARTGLIAFQATRRNFEFVVSDKGIGILASLRSCPDYASLNDHGEALSCALQDGNSRHGIAAGRGMGFRQLFIGLANLNGALRFRSGNHTLTIDGRSPTLMTAKLAQKPHIRGFVASVSCSL
jgi:hypothetical protein